MHIGRSVRRALFRTRSAIVMPFYRRMEASLVRRGSCVAWEQIQIYVDEEPEEHFVVETIIAALELIQESDPRRMRRIQSDVKRIFVTRLGRVRGAHTPGTRDLLISASYVLRNPIVNVAFLLVHEATHVHIEQRGVSLLPDIRRRMERRCRSEEISFARKLSAERYPSLNDWIAQRQRLEA